MANQTGAGPHRSGRRRRSRRRTRGTGTALKQIDPLDAIRVASLPVGLGASAWARSPWWFVAAAAYNIVGGPLHDFLAKVLGAAADRLADRIRHGSRRARALAQDPLLVDPPALPALERPPGPTNRPRGDRPPVATPASRPGRRRIHDPGGGRPDGQESRAVE